jgi:uncharacterized protein (DUF2147 family)
LPQHCLFSGRGLRPFVNLISPAELTIAPPQSVCDGTKNAVESKQCWGNVGGSPTQALGTWLLANGAVQVKFSLCGDATCSDFVWLKSDGDGKIKVGHRLFFDMHPAGANAWTAKAVNPGNGS